MANVIYVKYNGSENKYLPWNKMTFYGCKVLSIIKSNFEAGTRLSIEIEAPKLKKKYYLYAWDDNKVATSIINSNLEEGDVISCHAELSYYKNRDGRYCENYRIIADDSFNNNMQQTERNFQLMRIEKAPKKPQKSNEFISNQDLLKMITGV